MVESSVWGSLLWAVVNNQHIQYHCVLYHLEALFGLPLLELLLCTALHPPWTNSTTSRLEQRRTYLCCSQ
jgi:hypothetical protein